MSDHAADADAGDKDDAGTGAEDAILSMSNHADAADANEADADEADADADTDYADTDEADADEADADANEADADADAIIMIMIDNGEMKMKSHRTAP